MAKQTISARIDLDLYNYYKGLGIPLTTIIEALLIDFVDREDKIEFLTKRLEQKVKDYLKDNIKE